MSIESHIMDLFKQLGNPQVDWLASQLEKYQAGEASTPLQGVGMAQTGSFPLFGGQVVASGWTDFRLVNVRSFVGAEVTYKAKEIR
jgi:hypothetical protein